MGKQFTPEEAQAEMERVRRLLDARGVRYEPMTIRGPEPQVPTAPAWPFVPLDKAELIKKGDRHEVLLVRTDEKGGIFNVKATEARYLGSRGWHDGEDHSLPALIPFYSPDDLPKVLLRWMMQETDELRRDRFVYGNSFALNGQRVDPTHVVLSADGTYMVVKP